MSTKTTSQPLQLPPLNRSDAGNAASHGIQLAEFDTWARSTGSIPPDFQHRLAHVLPGDALENGWRCDCQEEKGVTDDIDSELELESVLEEAAGFARLGHGSSGGAYLFLVEAATNADWKEELKISEKPVAISAIHALELNEVRAVGWNADPMSKDLATPKSYNVVVSRGGININYQGVHASRLIYVGSGLKKRGLRRGADGSRDWSVGYAYLMAVADVHTGFASAARLLDRRSIPHLGLKDGVRKAAKEGVSGLSTYIRSFLAGLGGRGLAVTMGEDTFSFTAPAVSGTSDLLVSLAWRLCMVEGYSLSKLFGQPPGGLTSDDISASKNHSSMVGKYRKNVLVPVLKRVHAITMGVDSSRKYHWEPTDEPSDLEKAQASLARAQRDSQLILSGSISPEDSRRRFETGTEVSELTISGPVPELGPVGEFDYQTIPSSDD